MSREFQDIHSISKPFKITLLFLRCYTNKLLPSLGVKWFCYVLYKPIQPPEASITALSPGPHYLLFTSLSLCISYLSLSNNFSRSLHVILFFIYLMYRIRLCVSFSFLSLSHLILIYLYM